MESRALQLNEINQSIIMQEAKEDMTGRWGLGVATYIVYFLVAAIVSFIPFGSILVSGPFAVGLAIFGLKLARREQAEVGNVFDGFKQFGDAIGASILMGLGVGLGFLLLIVPGVILALGWSMTYYIIAENPNLGPVDAMKRSWELMDGYKADYFKLGLKFLLLGFLCILTLGIGFFFLAPFANTTFAKYYLVLNKIKGYAEDDVDDITQHLVV